MCKGQFWIWLTVVIQGRGWKHFWVSTIVNLSYLQHPFPLGKKKVILVLTITFWRHQNTTWSPRCLPNIPVWWIMVIHVMITFWAHWRLILQICQSNRCWFWRNLNWGLLRSLLRWKCFSAGRIGNQILNWHSWFSPVWISDTSK